MNIKIIKTVGLYVVAGIATAAGAALWNNVLQNKIDFAIEKHKNRKNNKVIKFNKNQKNNGEMNMGKVIIFNKNWSR